jgi:hypothetical protein
MDADSANKGETPPAAMAYQLECFAETFQNLSDGGHWKQPTFKAAPTTVPTTLPWLIAAVRLGSPQAVKASA